MWFKLIVCALVITTLGCGSPLSDDGLYNIEENKFKEVSQVDKRVKLADEPTTYRLPNDSIPISYEIRLKTDVDRADFNFSGDVRIHVKILEATQRVTLHYRLITIDKIDLFAINGTNIAANLPSETVASHDFLYIDLTSEYQPDDEFNLYIQYHGELRTDSAGFYRGSYVNEAGDTVWYATTQFEVTDARHAMPCYDEPGIRAPMTLSIIHNKRYSAIANMNVEIETDEDDDYVITKFEPTPALQTYLLAFLISDFDYINATETRIPQRIFAVPQAIANNEGAYAASIVGAVLQKLEEHIGVNFPNEKMDHAALTVFNFGAMENFGLITYINTGLLLNPSVTESTRYNRENSIVGLIAHEYAHQWFGDIVSPQWWTYTWLNEGFATLFASFIPSLIYPERKIMNNYVTSVMPRAFSSDLEGSWAMNHYTEIPDELWDKFGGIGYQKSGCVLRMFQEVLTIPVFAKGLNYYINATSMQAATPDNLHAGLQRAYDEEFPGSSLNIGELMYTWEDQPGYPIVSVQTLATNVYFSQTRYGVSGTGAVYSIPLTIATKSNANFTIKTPTKWLNSFSSSFPREELSYNAGDWIIVNVQQVGYYRVDYSTTLWRALIDQLTTDFTVIDNINRAVLQDEIYIGWTELDRVTAEDVLRILSYFGHETEPMTWGKAQTTITRLTNRLFGTDIYDEFLNYLKDITNPHIDNHGYYGFDGENAEIASLRTYTKNWNCLALEGKCLVAEYALFQQYHEGNSEIVFNYCNALRLAGEEIYEEVLTSVLTDRNYTNRVTFLTNLGCSLSTVNLGKLLNAIMDMANVLTASERSSIITNTFSRSTTAFETTLSFIETNYAALNSTIPSFTNVMRTIASYVNGENALFESVLNKLVEVNAIAIGDRDIIETMVASNAEWLQTNYRNVRLYFDPDYVEPTTTTTTTTAAPPTTTTTTTAATTPVPASTTPDSATSVILSMSAIIFCILVNLLKN